MFFSLQSAPFKCPVESCPYDTKVRHNLIVHYGVTHRNVFKLLNITMGGPNESGAENSLSRQTSATGAYTHYLTSYRNAYINVSLFRSILHRTQIYILSFPLATLIVQLHYFMEKPVSDVLNLDCTVVCPTLYSLGLS